MFPFIHRSAGAPAVPGKPDAPADPLIGELGSADGAIRQSARQHLVAMGAQGLPILEQALSDPHPAVRWEAAVALGELCDSSVCDTLAEALNDPDRNVRWAAAESFTRLGRLGLPSLFKVLMHRADSRNLRECAHGLLVAQNRGDLKPILQPVIAALEGIAPSAEVPPKAHAALHALRGEPDHRGRA